PTSDPLVEILEIVPPPQSEKRKNSCPPEGAETKKIKTEVTEEGDQQPGSSGETNQSEDVNRADANAEEQVSDSDREVAAIMATP
ncbi:hypothetical protein, partial [Halorubellus sp. PRR65]|uniref:hypothetical protein n=1 Tax=Halorubellus sp. PRR65 TaxID=3098148 RepID=UPI002B262E24